MHTKSSILKMRHLSFEKFESKTGYELVLMLLAITITFGHKISTLQDLIIFIFILFLFQYYLLLRTFFSFSFNLLFIYFPR